jgi:hypothetical protein
VSGARTDRWLLGGGLVGSPLICVLAWLFAVGPELANAAAVADETTATTQQNSLLRVRIDQLRSDSARLPDLQRSLAAAQAALPGDSGMPDLIRQVTRQAAAAGVSVGSITAGAPTAVRARTGAAPSTGTAPSGAAGSAGGGSAAPGASPGSVSPTAGAPGSGATGGALYAIPVTLTTTGPAARQQEFLQAVEFAGPRASLVTSAQLAPAGTTSTGSIEGGSTLTVQLQVFVAPSSVPAAGTG